MWGAMQAYLMFLVVLLAAVSRLPLKLTATKGPGRRHKAGGDNGERPIVTFADVAGVDEAKEELAEVVVSCLRVWRMCVPWVGSCVGLVIEYSLERE